MSTAVAILALALGIGVNTSIFTSISALILHPMPYPTLGRILTIWSSPRAGNGERDLIAPGDFAEFQAQNRSIEQMAAFEQRNVALLGTGQPAEVLGCAVTQNFFRVFGMRALFGRTFSANKPQDDHGTAVVSESFWRGYMGANTNAIGKTIVIAGQKRIVIGVMPDAFDFPLSTEVWLPLEVQPADQHDHTNRRWGVVGLLKAGATLQQARTETAEIGAHLAAQYPNEDNERGLLVAPLRTLVDGTTDRFLMVLLAATGFVLLLACANVGNLQLAKTLGRQKEITVRVALGASRMRVAREIFAESLLISLAGGLIGLVLTTWSTAEMRSSIPAVAYRAVPGLRRLGMDWTVVLLTIGAALIAGLLCSLPAIFQLLARGTRANLADALRGRSHDSAATVANRRMQAVLVTFELTVALVLLVGAGLMESTFLNLLNRYQGFDPKNVLTMRVSLPEAEYSGDKVVPFFEQTLQNLSELRSARVVSLSSNDGAAGRMSIEGQPELRPDASRPDLIAVSSGYLQAMRIPLYKGRFISENDGTRTERVVVISSSVAHRYWPKGDAIGQRIRFNGGAELWTVVGVTADVIDDWFNDRPSFTAYIPYTQAPSRNVTFLLRTAGDPKLAAQPARAAVRQLDKDLPLYDVKPLARAMDEQRGGIQASATMMKRCAIVALLLAITGLYAVLSYAVTTRTHEIGVRMAVGAAGLDILKMTMRQTVGLTALGLGFGIPLALLLAQAMSSVLYGMVTVSWTTFAAYALVLIVAAAAASYFPSRHASRIDPVKALRDQ
jgi:putative ABC transport system permease protein